MDVDVRRRSRGGWGGEGGAGLKTCPSVVDVVEIRAVEDAGSESQIVMTYFANTCRETWFF